uniref:Uncharacterized protein n=1 Tax=Haptolina ericina TaxID=156174 RepID=A0A7S3BQ22_9EUKA
MLEEMIAPLNVDVIILPAIKIVDGNKGMVPIPMVAGKVIAVQGQLKAKKPQMLEFMQKAKPGLVLCFWHITFAFMLKICMRPPPQMKVVHIAAQFALKRTLTLADLKMPLEVVTMATMDVMASIFEATGRCYAISPTSSDNALPPILELPPPLKPGLKPLILCYFLVVKDALKLERLLAKHRTGEDKYSFGGRTMSVEFHCFTANVLPTPKNRPLSLHSHPKQRQLFQDLFARCTGVIVSSGNETVWESVCRGVPVLTMPTTGHGEQLLNARIHARNFPSNVRKTEVSGCIEPGGKLTLDDVLWVVNSGTQTPTAESAQLRARVGDLEQQAIARELPMLRPPDEGAALPAPILLPPPTEAQLPAGRPATALVAAGMFGAGMLTMWVIMGPAGLLGAAIL